MRGVEPTGPGPAIRAGGRMAGEAASCEAVSDSPAQAVAELNDWLRGSTFDKLADHVGFEPVDLAAYDEVFAQMGWPMPPSYRALLEAHGRLRVPDLPGNFELPSGSCALTMATPAELFELYLHVDRAIVAGVPRARQWLLFASAHPAEPELAFAFDEKLGDGTEPAVGCYRAPEVLQRRPGLEDPLPDTMPGFQPWLCDFVARLRAGLLRSDRAALVARIRTLGQPAPKAPDWTRVWSDLERGKIAWNGDAFGELSRVLRQTDDDAVVARILREVTADLDRSGARVVDPTIARVLDTGRWPRGYPGPRELLGRLPADGPGSRRAVARFCLDWTGVDARHSDLVDAGVVLGRLCAGEAVAEPDRLTAMKRCADIGRSARGAPTSPAQAEAFHARAMTWCLGREVSPTHVLHVATLTMQLGALARSDAGQGAGLSVPATARPFTLITLFQKLADLSRGRDALPGDLNPRVERPAAPALGELEAWLAGHEGSQRERLDAFEAQWLPRLRALDPEPRGWACKAVRKSINSKKLKARRDALLAGLD